MARNKLSRHSRGSEPLSTNQGPEQEATALAIKRELASELHRAMKKQKMSQSELARRMKTSRAVVHRLLKRDDPSVTLSTISRAAVALGRSVKVRIKN
ncbi:MAG TPA: helix-turn-helix transcriptional regulator [Steroidobacteraceae bacterium]|jgi:antitoxin HicB